MLLYLGLSYLSIMVMAKAKTKETTEIKEEKASKKKISQRKISKSAGNRRVSRKIKNNKKNSG